MKTISIAYALIGFTIISLWLISFVENAEILLQVDENQTNQNKLTLLCYISGMETPEINFIKTDTYEAVIQDEPNGISIIPPRMFLEFSKIRGTTVADARYHCQAKSMDGKYFISKSFEFKIKDYIGENSTVQEPEEPSLHLRFSNRNDKYNLVVGEFVNLLCEVRPSKTDILAPRWFRWGVHGRQFEEIFDHFESGQTIEKEGKKLQLSSLQKEQAGAYQCRSATAKGIILRSNIQIINKIRDPVEPTTSKINVLNVVEVPVPMTTTEFDDTTLNLELGDGIKQDDILQHDDVYLRCEMKSTKAKLKTRSWYHNEKPILSYGIRFNSSKLELLDIKPTSKGWYTCKIETDGDVLHESDPVLITVKEKPYVLINGMAPHAEVGVIPYPYLIREYDNVYMTCDIKPNLKNIREVIWVHNEEKLIRKKDEIDVLPASSTLILPNITKSFTGNYKCRIIFANSSIAQSNNIKIKVLDDPNPNKKDDLYIRPLVFLDLITHPDMIAEGDTVEFKCNVYANRANIRIILWYRDNQSLKLTKGGRIDGIHRTLWIQNIEKPDVGNYTCEAYVFPFRLMSMPVQLSNMKPRPKLTELEEFRSTTIPSLRTRLGNYMNNYNALTGDSVYFNCEVTPDTYNIRSISWFHHGKIERDHTIDFLFGNYTMVLTQLTLSSAGEYYCQARTKTSARPVMGEVAFMNVESKTAWNYHDDTLLVPELLEHPDRVVEHDAVYFFCNIYPRQEEFRDVVWLRDGKELKKMRSTNVTYEKQTLMFNGIKQYDAGSYSCEYTIDGITYSSFPTPPIQIKKFMTSHITKEAARLEVGFDWVKDINNMTTGDNVRLTCNMNPNSTTILRLIWSRDYYPVNRIIHSKSAFAMEVVGLTLEDNNHTLIFSGVTKWTSADYFCTAYTKKGTFNAPITLNVT